MTVYTYVFAVYSHVPEKFRVKSNTATKGSDRSVLCSNVMEGQQLFICCSCGSIVCLVVYFQ